MADVAHTWLDSSNFPSIQNALDSLPSYGGCVYVPAGTWVQNATIVMPKDRPAALVGAGVGATRLFWSNPDIDCIRVMSSESRLQCLSIQGPNRPTSTTVGRGIVVGRLAAEQTSPPSILRNVVLRDVQVMHTARWALYVLGADPAVDPGVDGNSVSILCRVEDCSFGFNVAVGLIRVNAGNVSWTFDNCNIGSQKGVMMQLVQTANIRIVSGAFDNPLEDTQPFVLLDRVAAVHFDTVDFENQVTPNPKQFFIKVIGTLNYAILVNNCVFGRTATVAKVVQVPSGAAVHTMAIINPRILLNVMSAPTGTDDFDFSTENSEITVIGGLLATTRGPSPIRILNASPRTVLANVNNRFRLPRVTTAERDTFTDREPGDMVFNTTTNRAQVCTQVSPSVVWSDL